MCVCVCVCVFVCLYVWCVRMCVYVCMYVCVVSQRLNIRSKNFPHLQGDHTHTHTHTHTSPHTYIHTSQPHSIQPRTIISTTSILHTYHIRTNARTHTYAHIHTHANTHTYTHYPPHTFILNKNTHPYTHNTHTHTSMKSGHPRSKRSAYASTSVMFIPLTKVSLCR